MAHNFDFEDGACHANGAIAGLGGSRRRNGAVHMAVQYRGESNLLVRVRSASVCVFYRGLRYSKSSQLESGYPHARL